MKVVFLNISGFNKVFKQYEVKFFMAVNKVSVIGVLETRVKLNRGKIIVVRMFKKYLVENI